MEAAMGMLKTVAIAVGAIIAVLWLLTIIWVIRDAGARGVSKAKWGIIAIIPFIGALIYIACRPPLLAADKEDIDLGTLLTRRQLMDYGECGRCGYPVEKDYVMCPNCGAQLKNVCPNCGRPINPEWSVCPYCCTPSARAVAANMAPKPEPATQFIPAPQPETALIGEVGAPALPDAAETLIAEPVAEAEEAAKPSPRPRDRSQRSRVSSRESRESRESSSEAPRRPRSHVASDESSDADAAQSRAARRSRARN
ncbi:MAG: zinc ribbon domain-containing protein [Coriobacteriales bacterium]|nr:zinc ribbon domain-containing protein [Coriobacteriales bacterium]